MPTFSYDQKNPKNAVLSLKAAILADAVMGEFEIMFPDMTPQSKKDFKYSIELEIKLKLEQIGGV